MAAIDWNLDLAGDGRCDSRGHSALYGAFTMTLHDIYHDITGTKLDAWLCQELLSKRLIADLRKAGVQNTAQLESFHKQLNHFAPKMVGFSYDGMNSR